jgi:uncharacterized protein YjiS (DUF1127 family)
MSKLATAVPRCWLWLSPQTLEPDHPTKHQPSQTDTITAEVVMLPPSILRRVGLGIRRLASRMLDAYRARQTSGEFLACSDLLLRDLGITRMEIRYAVLGRD